MSSPSKFDDATLFDSLQEHVKEEVGTEVLGGGSMPTTATENKRLVLLMGPQGLHHWDDLVAFFLHNMSEYRPQQHLEALHGWTWPAIHLPSDENTHSDASISHTRILDLLSNENDDNIRTAIMQQLSLTWQQSTHGILMGAPTWDQNSSHIVAQLRDNFGISNEQIHLVWMIPPSYFPQWHFFYENDDGESYQEWICDPSQTQSHLQRLETSLNTVRLATQFLVATSTSTADFSGISVTLLDQWGVMQAQQSLPHVIACRILNVPTCQNGWIPGLDREVSVVDIPTTNMDSPISLDDQLEFEALLQDRDCAHQKELENHPHFRHLFPAALWENCPDEDDDADSMMGGEDTLYHRLQNATLILEQIQIESNCHVVLGDAGTTTSTAGITTDAPIASPLPTMTPQMLSDLEEVESSLESSTRWGIVVLTLLLILMTVWIGLIRRRRRAASRKEQQVLRSWEHDENMDIHRFDMSTVKTCHVSGRYDEEEERTPHNNKERNLHYYQDYDDDEDDVHTHNTPSVPQRSRPQVMPPSSLYYKNDDFEEIDLKWTAASESAELERIQGEGIMS